MKFIVVLGDGMADIPVPELGGKTPLQYAKTPTVDAMAKFGTVGLVKTVPDSLPPGSDTANLSVMGYDPFTYYSGRSPLEAASLRIPMKDTDVIFRCNFVTTSEEPVYAERTMIDHSADEISTEEAAILLTDVNAHFSSATLRFHPGFGYRHIMVWDKGPSDWNLTPPHDILERQIGAHLPKGSEGSFVSAMMEKSSVFLAKHEINRKRVEKGLRPANSIWIWGEGKKPLLSSFKEKYGLEGTVISAVDLIKGIGVSAGLATPNIPGATGNIHTDYAAKVKAALDALASGHDFVYLHIEAPDECGHRQEISNKVRSIELIDEKVITPLKQALDETGEDYKIMFLPDHPTPLALRTHTSDPVPFLIYNRGSVTKTEGQVYDEDGAAKSGIFIKEGFRLMDYFITGTAGGQ